MIAPKRRCMRHLLLARQSMALAVDVMHGHGRITKCISSYSQKDKVKAVLAVSMAAKGIIRTVHY